MKPESGGNAEAGLSVKWNQRNIQGDISATVWARYLKNPIVWLPVNNFWSASNMQRGDYRGAQFSSTFSSEAGKIRWQWQTGVEWCNTRMLNNGNRFNALFVPRISGASSLKLQRRFWFLNTGLQWQSMRYVSTDNTSTIPAYALFSMQAGKEIKFRQHDFLMSAGADNMLNQSYEVMPGRPMPMRSFWVKINMKFNNKK
jgi:outer membrane cobalamin receptor